jgi:hypothetical protein
MVAARPLGARGQEGVQAMDTASRPVRAVVALIAAAALVLVFAVGPAAARAPEAIRIVSHMNFNPDGFNFGDFDATGAAVDDGTVCASGTVDDTRIILAGFQSNSRIQIPVWKTFTCDDDSGTFFVRIQVHLDLATSTETFSWVIQGGTGDYVGLRGSGQGTTVSDGSDPQTGNFNTYEGFVVG